MRLKQYIKENRWYDAAMPITYVIAFASGTCNHVADLIRGGFLPYSKMYGVPEGFNYYWTSLTILDPIAVAAIFLNVRMGCVIALCIMLTDVPINVYVNANYWKLPFHKNYALMMQTGFMIFLLITTRRVWRSSGTTEDSII